MFCGLLESPLFGDSKLWSLLGDSTPSGLPDEEGETGESRPCGLTGRLLTAGFKPCDLLGNGEPKPCGLLDKLEESKPVRPGEGELGLEKDGAGEFCGLLERPVAGGPAWNEGAGGESTFGCGLPDKPGLEKSKPGRPGEKELGAWTGPGEF